MISIILARKAGLQVAAIYFNIISARILMISNCYLESEGESVLQDSPPILI